MVPAWHAAALEMLGSQAVRSPQRERVIAGSADADERVLGQALGWAAAARIDVVA
jgi:hypothetical protein